MASPMISIDFGNSYTKVAIRPGENELARLLEDDALSLDELHICVPTLAARFDRGGKHTWSYGTDVMQYRDGTPGLTVYRNWKPFFFEDVETRLALPQPVTSGRSLALLAWGDLTTDEQQTLAGLGITPDNFEAVRGALSTQFPQRRSDIIPARVSSPHLDVQQVGAGFFRWLRVNYVEPECQKLQLGSASEIPVRISLPSFGAQSKAEQLLCDVLEDAGWKPDKVAPALAEPLANAIGTFSEGRNATWSPRKGKTSPHNGRMFSESGFHRRIREALLVDGARKVAWTMIVDLGGYTADFAMIGLSLDAIDARLEGQIDGMPKTATYSEPIGITTLDQRIRALLGAAREHVIDEMAQDPDQRRLETFHRTVYGKFRPYTGRRGKIGFGEEMGEIRNCVEAFAEEIANCAEKFLEIHQYREIDDLILTGGGSLLPSIRNSLRDRLRGYGVRQTHTYTDPTESQQPGVHPLNLQLVRGATALGGASVYFDFASPG